MDSSVNGGQDRKLRLRRQYMAWRKGLGCSEWQSRSRLLCDRLRGQSALQKATVILAYQSYRQEPDLSFLWTGDRDEMLSKTWGLPRCLKAQPSDKKPTQLCWHQWTPGETLAPGTYGLLEPDAAWPIISADRVDVILVPMVAGDRQGYRLGYGGGFYDRLFSKPQWRRALKVGLTFDELLVDCLPRESWDQPLDAICTDQQWLTIDLSA